MNTLNPLYAAFLAEPSDARGLGEPFRANNHTIYCNGQTMIATQCECERETPKRLRAERMAEIIDQTEGALRGELFTIEPIEYHAPTCMRCKGTKKTQICPECNGDGWVKLENDYNEYECDCQTCDAGALKEFDCERCPQDEIIPVAVRNTVIQAKYINLAQQLPGVVFAISSENSLVFKFNGGMGYIMDMNADKAEIKTAQTHPHKDA